LDISFEYFFSLQKNSLTNLLFKKKAFLLHRPNNLSSITGINKVQLSQYVRGRRHPSQKTQQKIKASVISFAEELKRAMA
jgi:hypothetical protein